MSVCVCAAAGEGDKFCQDVFHRAGRHLGRMARTCLFPRRFHSRGGDSAAAEAPLLPAPAHGDVVSCVCVGSVWKSFRLLARGFEEAVFPSVGLGSDVRFTLELLQLNVSSAVGAAWAVAKVCTLPPRLLGSFTPSPASCAGVDCTPRYCASSSTFPSPPP